MIRQSLIAGTLICLAACGADDVPGDPAASATPETVPTKESSDIAPDNASPAQQETDPDLAATEAHYDEKWHVGYGWPGEYPAGFSVQNEAVRVQARSRPDKSMQPNITCPLPHKATYQVWNEARVQSDDLVFITATEILPMDVITDSEFVTYVAENDEYVEKSIPVKTGETVEYLSYFGEGFGLVRYNGVVYETDLQQFDDFTRYDERPSGVDEWVRLTCDDAAGTRAWVLNAEALETSGIIITPVTGYGESTDLE